MSDELTLIQAILKTIMGLLSKAGEKGSETAGERTASAILNFLRDRFKGKTAQALADLEQQPGDLDRQQQFGKLLLDQLKLDGALAAELASQLGRAGLATGSQLATAGDNARVNQIMGSGNTIGS
jgi:hypothetical protein